MLMYRPIVLRDIYRGLAVQIYGKSMKIGNTWKFWYADFKTSRTHPGFCP